MRIKIYIAGPYQGSLMEGLDHIRAGIRAATELMLSGYSPYCPFVDYHYDLMRRGDEKLSIEDYYQCSLAWLYVSNAMLVLPGWIKSKGVIAELKVAKKEGIPVFFSIDELRNASIDRMFIKKRGKK